MRLERRASGAAAGAVRSARRSVVTSAGGAMPSSSFSVDDVRLDVLEGAGAVAGAIERLGDAAGDARIQRIGGGEAAPAFERAAEVAAVGAGRREAFERPAVEVVEALALRTRPPLELLAPFDEEAVEERPRVKADRFVERAAVDGVLEGAGVAGEGAGAETQLAGRRGDRVAVAAAEGAVDDVDRVRQQMTRAVAVALRPQRGGELLAAEALTAAHGEQREHGEAPPLGHAAGQRAFGSFHTRTA